MTVYSPGLSLETSRGAVPAPAGFVQRVEDPRDHSNQADVMWSGEGKGHQSMDNVMWREVRLVPVPGTQQGSRRPPKSSGSQQRRREGCGGSANGQTDSPGPTTHVRGPR